MNHLLNFFYKFLFIFALSYFPLLAENYTDFDRFQCVYTQEQLAFKLNHYLIKDPSISEHFLLTNEAFSLYASAEDKKSHRPEFTLTLASTPQAIKDSKLKTSSMDGLKIAIDPGHFGGRFAKLEQRWIEMAINKPKHSIKNISFNEGTLTLLTAKALKMLLEEAGAQVLLTKESNGTGVYSEDFFQWLAHSPTNPTSSLTDIFRPYNRLDLIARAKKINAFAPSLTIIIHYNAHGERDLLTQENIPQSYNYNMVFVGGGFCQNELDDLQSRQAFLRLLLTSDLELSIDLSKEILTQFIKHLAIPAVQDQDPVPYLKKTSLKISEGVYARNLALTRLIQGPLCYGESLCQDNEQECVRLNDKDFIIDSIQGPKRVKQVAQAYFDGIHAFIKSRVP